MYSSECNKSVFTRLRGFNQWLHVYERLKDHENSKSHCELSKCYIRHESGNIIDGLIEFSGVIGNMKFLKEDQQLKQ